MPPVTHGGNFSADGPTKSTSISSLMRFCRSVTVPRQVALFAERVKAGTAMYGDDFGSRQSPYMFRAFSGGGGEEARENGSLQIEYVAPFDQVHMEQCHRRDTDRRSTCCRMRPHTLQSCCSPSWEPPTHL